MYTFGAISKQQSLRESVMDSNSKTTHEATGMTPADWALAWSEHLRRSGLEANLRRAGVTEEAFWERFGAWSDTLERSGYPGELLERLMALVRPGDSVLDIGAGAGAYAIPVARVASRVTAVEPSEIQCTRLQRNVENARLSNVTIVRSRWEDIEPSRIEPHHVVLAAFCFQMHDIRAALDAMCQVARRSLVLIHADRHDLRETLTEVCGIEAGPNYEYIEAELRAMGHVPDVDILTRIYRVLLETQLDILQYNPGLTLAQCDSLREYLGSEGRLLTDDGQTLLERRIDTAFIHVAL